MLDAAGNQALQQRANRIRQTLLRMHHTAKSGHIGTGLSSIDVLCYLYSHVLDDASRFVLSKGHGASALYATLHEVDLLSDRELATYYQEGTLLPAHPAPLGHPAIHVATGSLGHGLPVAVGLAYATKKFDGRPRQVVCMLSDGECNEGTVWEAAMFAGHHRLDNLTVVIDCNGLQGFGTTAEVLDLQPLAAKWQAFRFASCDVDAHDFPALAAAFAKGADAPRCLVAHSVKGKGVSFMENQLAWHYRTLGAEDFGRAMAELQAAATEAACAG